jgi:hypothetical protein
MARSTYSTYGKVRDGERIQFLYNDSRVYVKLYGRVIRELGCGERFGNGSDERVVIMANTAPPRLSVVRRSRRRVEIAVLEQLARRPYDSTSYHDIWASLPTADRRLLRGAIERLKAVRLIAHPERSHAFQLTGQGVRRAAAEGLILTA